MLNLSLWRTELYTPVQSRNRDLSSSLSPMWISGLVLQVGKPLGQPRGEGVPDFVQILMALLQVILVFLSCREILEWYWGTWTKFVWNLIYWCSPRKILVQMCKLAALFPLHRCHRLSWWALHFQHQWTGSVTTLLVTPWQGRALLIWILFAKLFVQTAWKLFQCGRLGCQYKAPKPDVFPMNVLRAKLFQWNTNLKPARFILSACSSLQFELKSEDFSKAGANRIVGKPMWSFGIWGWFLCLLFWPYRIAVSPSPVLWAPHRAGFREQCVCKELWLGIIPNLLPQIGTKDETFLCGWIKYISCLTAEDTCTVLITNLHQETVSK